MFMADLTNKSTYKEEDIVTWPHVHKAFQNQNQDQAQVKKLWIVFKAYHNYLTIDCLYLIKYVLQTKVLGILSFFMKEKVNLIFATVAEF